MCGTKPLQQDGKKLAANNVHSKWQFSLWVLRNGSRVMKIDRGQVELRWKKKMRWIRERKQ